MASGRARGGRVRLVNEFLGYLVDRNFSPRTCRAYAYDLLGFTRWLLAEDVALTDVDVDVMLRFFTACREATPRGRPGGNVYSIRDGRNTGYAPATMNRRLAAISPLFAFREMCEVGSRNPIPKGRAARMRASGERGGLLAHVGTPKPRSKLRVREPRRLPRGRRRCLGCASPTWTPTRKPTLTYRGSHPGVRPSAQGAAGEEVSDSTAARIGMDIIVSLS